MLTGQSSRSSDAFNSAVVKSICDQLTSTSTTQQRRGPLYGADIDAMTDVMDDVIGRVDWVALDDCMLEASGLRFLAVLRTRCVQQKLAR